MMWWRLLITLLLVAIVAVLVWDRDRVVSVLPQLSSPHDAYVSSLKAAGLADTALARDWIAAAEAALHEPTDTRVPIETTVTSSAAEPRAYGYRLALERGRVLRVALQVDSPEEPLVFIDVFRVRDGDAPERVASAAREGRELEHEIRREGTYILRIQPELLRGGAMRLVQSTTAALTFPVTGRDVSAVGSVFRDPRDGGSREHHGIDIFAPRDTPVLAASDGYVTSAGTSRLGGNVVWVWDPARHQSHYYAHLSRQAVSTGQRVRAGDLIGFVGNTGNARGTPPHLHFGIYARGEGPIDPLPFVRGARGPQASTGGRQSAGSLTRVRLRPDVALPASLPLRRDFAGAPPAQSGRSREPRAPLRRGRRRAQRGDGSRGSRAAARSRRPAMHARALNRRPPRWEVARPTRSRRRRAPG